MSKFYQKNIERLLDYLKSNAPHRKAKNRLMEEKKTI